MSTTTCLLFLVVAWDHDGVIIVMQMIHNVNILSSSF
jgi:hypothetical protein